MTIMRSAVRLAACLGAIGVVQAQQSPQTRDWTDDDTFRDAVLNGTNTYRHQHNVDALTWSDKLADAAKDWADACEWGHSGGPTGENLATGYQTVDSAIAAWGDERDVYNFARGDFSMETGHFTQLVWRTTQRVGCARIDCGPSPKLRIRRHTHRERERKDVEVLGKREQRAWNWYLVCEYDPPGNVLGSFGENVPEQVNTDAFPGGQGGEGQPEEPAEEPEDEDDRPDLVPVNDVFTNHAAPPVVPEGASWLIGAVAVAVNLGG